MLLGISAHRLFVSSPAELLVDGLQGVQVHLGHIFSNQLPLPPLALGGRLAAQLGEGVLKLILKC